MNSRKTLFWAVVAAGLFGFIYFFQRPGKRSCHTGSAPEMHPVNPAGGHSSRSGPAGQLEIRAERTDQDGC